MHFFYLTPREQMHIESALSLSLSFFHSLVCCIAKLLSAIKLFKGSDKKNSTQSNQTKQIWTNNVGRTFFNIRLKALNLATITQNLYNKSQLRYIVYCVNPNDLIFIAHWNTVEFFHNTLFIFIRVDFFSRHRLDKCPLMSFIWNFGT